MRILLKTLLRILLNWYEKYLQINMMKRSISQNEAKAKTTKRYRFRERMLFQISRIWTFRVLINRRVLIDCKFWNRKSLTTTSKRTDKNLKRKRARLTAWQTHIDCCFSFLLVMSFALVSLYVINSSSLMLIAKM